MSSGRRILLVLCGFLSLAAYAPANDSPPSANKSSSTSMMPMPMVAPMFLETGEFSSTLYMVNGLRVPATAKITLFDLNGNEIREEEVKFDPDSEHHLSIRQELDEAGSPVTAGSLRVDSLTEHGMGILAQLAITHHGPKEGYFDEELAMPSAMGSSMLRAVADASGPAVVVSITNLASNSTQNVTIVGVGEGSLVTKTLRLAPNQTKFVRPCSAESLDRFDGAVASDFPNITKSSAAACGVSITSNGMPGELAAYGIAYHPAEGQGYFSSLNFSDPKVLRSAGFVYPGVPVGATSLLPEGNYGARLMLANFGTRESQVTVQYASTSNGQTGAKTLATIPLPANSTKIAEFTNLTGDPGLQNSFVVQADSGPGVVISKLVSFGNGALREVEILGKDEKQLENTGNHPWSIGDGVTSTLILFNHADSEQTFFVKVGGDKLIWRKDYSLAPMETRAISINDLISSEAKDDKGNTLPRDMRRGEVVWLAPHSSDVSGRILQSDKLLAMARNFSCGTCGFLCGGSLNPDSSLTTFIGSTGDLGDITPDFCDVPCQVYTSCPSGGSTMSGTTYYSWSGGGTVATLASGGSTSMSSWKGTAGGYTTVTYSMTMGEGSGYQCTGTAPVTVVSVNLTIQSSGSAATDNAARGAYNSEVGTYNLGPIIATGQECSIGYQVTGSVSPSTYTGTINLVRTYGGVAYTGSTGQTVAHTYPTGTADTSQSRFQDTNPQSGGSNGVVYDLDAPGVVPAVSQVGRIRYNFAESAQLPDGTYVSNQLSFYVRLSCNWGSAGNSFRNDVTGDNTLGMGTTKTSWNLQ